MLQIAIIEDEADLAQQTKVNAVRYLTFPCVDLSVTPSSTNPNLV